MGINQPAKKIYLIQYRQNSSNAMKDICTRHRGNANSKAAFEGIQGCMSKRRHFVLQRIKACAKNGLTVDELSERTGYPPNVLSGRFTELFAAGFIRKDGTRPTRAGYKATVYKSV